MKKLSTIIIALMFVATISKAQTTAMDFNRNDCNGTTHHLFEDLDSGKAVVLFFYMPNCGSCPPPAKTVQKMITNFHKHHPGAIKAYAMPYNNTAKCMDISSWVTTNNLSSYTPMDSGATQVAYYGGFGMPTVVLLGGIDHRVMFSTQNFTTSDTTVMSDSIMNMVGGTTTGINDLPAPVASFNLYPNPVSDVLNINLAIKESVMLTIDVVDITGNTIAVIMNEKVIVGTVSKQLNTSQLLNGNYLLRINANDSIVSKLITVTH